MNAPNASGWKPGTPVTVDHSMEGPPTVTGNRALMLEEPLIFELAGNTTTGSHLAGAEHPSPTPSLEGRGF